MDAAKPLVNTDDGAAWTKFSQQGLAAAYGDAEPEYSLNMVREPNPSYERG